MYASDNSEPMEGMDELAVYMIRMVTATLSDSDCLPAECAALFSHFLGTLQAACTPVQLGTGADYRRIHPGAQARPVPCRSAAQIHATTYQAI